MTPFYIEEEELKVVLLVVVTGPINGFRYSAVFNLNVKNLFYVCYDTYPCRDWREK